MTGKPSKLVKIIVATSCGQTKVQRKTDSAGKIIFRLSFDMNFGLIFFKFLTLANYLVKVSEDII